MNIFDFTRCIDLYTFSGICANSTCGAAMYYIEKNLKKYKNIYYYKPGMYEYMLLRRAYGSDKFPIDGKCTSIKRFEHFTLKRRYNKN